MYISIRFNAEQCFWTKIPIIHKTNLNKEYFRDSAAPDVCQN